MNTQTNIHAVGQEIELETLEINTMIKFLSHVTFNFAAVLMYQLHVIQIFLIEQMKTRESAIF